LLEPNAKPGLTNRAAGAAGGRSVGRVSRGRRPLSRQIRSHGGSRTRRLLALPDRQASLARLGLSPEYRTLLAIGGSQGARTINDALVALVRQGRLPDGWQLVLVTGRNDYERVRDSLAGAVDARAAVFPYVSDLSDAYACADLVLARAARPRWANSRRSVSPPSWFPTRSPPRTTKRRTPSACAPGARP